MIAGAVALLVALVVGPLAAPAHAEFRVAPSLIELDVARGGTAAGAFEVILDGETRSRLTVEPEDVVQLPDGGFTFRAPTGAPEAPSSWLSVSPRRFAGAPDRAQPVEFRLAVPRDAEPGEHTASLTVKRRGPANPGEQATIVQAISVRVTIRVRGRAREGVDVALDAPGVAGRGPVRATLRVRNTGTTNLRFDGRNRGSLAFRQGDAVKARVALRGVLLPRQTRTVTLPWQDPPLAGKISVRGQVRTAEGVVARTAETWMVPWRHAAALALLSLGIAVLLGGRRQRSRHGGEADPDA